MQTHLFRFFASQSSSHPREWEVLDEELFHLKKVLRLKEGVFVEVFDGRGCWGQGTIRELSARAAKVEVTNLQLEKRLDPSVALGIGVLQPGSVAELIPFLVELGVDAVHFFLHEGVQKNRISEKIVERWQRIALASAKQSKRAWLPELTAWPSLDAFLVEKASQFSKRLLLEPRASEALWSVQVEKGKPTCCVIGSEKGFTIPELQCFAKEGFENVSLGSLILRSVTASIASATIISSKRLVLAGTAVHV